MTICKLCLEEKKLIKKSHIYPDFLYKSYYDEHHRLRKFDLSEMLKINPKIHTPPTGVYEGGILCRDCENRISKYETYVSKLINGNLSGNETISVKGQKNIHGLMISEINNLNYKKLKLFLFSILFRASISSQSEFRDVNLGPYEKILRNAIIYDDVSNLNIQISILKFARNSNFTRFIAQPIRSKIEHTTVYSVVINGYFIIFFLKENNMSKQLKEINLSDNKLAILHVPKQQVELYIKALMTNK